MYVHTYVRMYVYFNDHVCVCFHTSMCLRVLRSRCLVDGKCALFPNTGLLYISFMPNLMHML